MPKERILRVRELGAHGVNLVETPLHLAENELISAQNTELSRETGELAIRKRRGLSAFGTLTGPVFAMTAVPLEDPTGPPVTPTTVVMLHGDDGNGRFGTTSSGTLAGIDPPYRGAARATGPIVARLGTRLIYGAPSGDYGAFWSGTLLAYDFSTGATSTLYTLADDVGASAELHALLAYEGRLYLCYKRATPDRVYVVGLTDVEGWVEAQMGDFVGVGGLGNGTFAWFASMAIFDDQLWLALYSGEFPWTVSVYSSPFESSGWTLDHTTLAQSYPNPTLSGSTEYLWLAHGGSPNKVLRRSPTGVWTEVYNQDDAAQITLLGSIGSACYWIEGDFLDLIERISGTIDGSTTSIIAEYATVYECTRGTVSNGKLYFELTVDRNDPPYACQEIDGLVLSTRFTVLAGDNDYTGPGGVG